MLRHIFKHRKSAAKQRTALLLKMSGLSRSFSISPIIKETFTPTGDVPIDAAKGLAYAKAVGMDQANTEMTVIAATQGLDAAAKAMIDESGGDYFAMRARYG